jgi:hypothetical protein
MHAPVYRHENEGALRQDWPRLPLPASAQALRASAALGREVAALLDVETPVPGVDAGAVRPDLRLLARPEHTEKSSLDPSTDLAVTAGWGYLAHHGATMPGGGTTDARAFTPDEAEAVPAGARERWGGHTLDVYWNEACRWAHVPERVWTYTLGGYPVVKKWLSYREAKVLGRPLRIEEVQHVRAMVRRLAALLLLEPRLDANYDAVKAATG